MAGKLSHQNIPDLTYQIIDPSPVEEGEPKTLKPKSSIPGNVSPVSISVFIPFSHSNPGSLPPQKKSLTRNSKTIAGTAQKSTWSGSKTPPSSSTLTTSPRSTRSRTILSNKSEKGATAKKTSTPA